MRQNVGPSRALKAALFLIAVAAFPPERAAARSVDAREMAVAAICDHAANIAARGSGVPLDVLRAISLTETGRSRGGRITPWPWTVNMEGTGKWFDDRQQAEAYVTRHFKRGARSFDVGCFQINYRWHGKAFKDYAAMFDPIANAEYAARFLKSLHKELGDWSRAAGAYHSRTRKYATKYRRRFDRLRADLGPSLAPGFASDQTFAATGDGSARRMARVRNMRDALQERMTGATRTPYARPGGVDISAIRLAGMSVSVSTPRSGPGSLFYGGASTSGLLRPGRPLFGR